MTNLHHVTPVGDGIGPKISLIRRWAKLARRQGRVLALIVVAIYLVLAYVTRSWLPFFPERHLPMSFDGDSVGLKATQIVPTLDTPMEKGKNVIWCGTFEAGWKQLENKVTQGPVKLEGAAEICSRLNSAEAPANSMPPDAFYANAGTTNKGIIQTIHRDMAAKFPKHTPPTFQGIPTGGYVLYSYLEAHVPFTIPYFDNREPLEFTDSNGVKTKIHSFGLRKVDRDRYGNLRHQARYIMEKWVDAGHKRNRSAFAIDLCADSSPCQIVVARVPAQPTLGAIIKTLDRDIATYHSSGVTGPRDLGGDDILLVPDMFWRLEHHFRELEGHAFGNEELRGQEVSVAVQDIQFRLDKSGAELGSEAESHWASAMGGGDPIFDGPFLLYIKKRGAATPFFVMWVDNAELLQRWG